MPRLLGESQSADQPMRKRDWHDAVRTDYLIGCGSRD